MKAIIQELSKAYGDRDIFANFSLDLDSGTRLCVCGPNGAGKSTFLRLLAGVDDPDSGRIIYPKGCRVGYAEQEISEEDLARPLMDYVMEGAHDWSEFWRDWEAASEAGDEERLAALMDTQARLESIYGFNPEQRAREALTGLGFAPEKWREPLRELSGGWRERAKLARILTAGADVLLLDEPTNHLDLDAVEWLENFLLAFQGILVFVAHDRVFMDKIGTRVLYMGLSGPVFRKTGYADFLALQEEYNRQTLREAKALEDEYKRKMAFVERFRAKATKARQAGSRQKMAKKLERELDARKPEPKRKELSFSWPEAPHGEKTTLAAADLAFSFPDGKTMWPPLSFNLYRGEKVALVGANGSGKSTLLKLIAGQLTKTGGTLATGAQTRLGYYSQHHTEKFNGENTVLGETRRLSDPALTEEELMSVLGLFLLGQRYFDRQIKTLSGGEKSRLALALLFLKRCNFLALDEPTNNLDLESREALIQALRRYDGTLLLVAHDRWLLREIGVEIWKLDQNGFSVYENYDAYERARKGEVADAGEAAKTPLNAPAAPRAEQKKSRREQAEKRNALYRQLKPLQTRYEELDGKFARTIERQSEVERLLADPEIYADSARAGELLKEFELLRRDAEAVMGEMARLEEEIGERKKAAGEADKS